MLVLIGLAVVSVSVFVGFAIEGGPLLLLVQPVELMIIAGTAVGTLLIGAPGRMRARVIHVFKLAFKDTIPKKKDYLDGLKLQYELFMMARRQGVLALESHAIEPLQSDLFKKYPAIIDDDTYRVFLAEALQHMANGVSADDLESLLDAELDTFSACGLLANGLVQKLADALPALGIIAAVLGVIVTMSHMDAPPAVIGHHIGAALVGTFLGILVSYGVVAPMVTTAELQEAHHRRFMEMIKASVIASLRGAAPAIAVEFGRKMIYADERPSFQELDAALQSLKGG